MKELNMFLASALVAAIGRPSVADRCLGIPAGQIVWCDDFDNYCTDGETWSGYPPFPAACPTDGSAVPDDAAFLANWALSLNCVWADNQMISADPARAEGPPFALKFRGMGYPGESGPTNLASSRHVFPILPAIQAKDSAKNAVNGTDASPLRFAYRLNHYTSTDCAVCGADAGNAIWYAELALGDDRAPTDYILKHCDYATESSAIYPVICQQRQAVAGCPPLDTTVHASIAVGLMALMDTYPCDVENGRRPTNYHLSVFDGLKWLDLRENLYPGYGDFGVGVGGPAQVYVEVRTSTIFVTWDVVLDGLPQHSEATIPRRYLGPFDRVGSGPGPGCELDPVTHTCISDYDCFKYCDQKPNWCWRNTFVDSLVLYDGVLEDLRGACCQPDGSCSPLHAGACADAGGLFQGSGTTCEETACCPTPFANWDKDADVDMDDFAALQRCLTLGGGPIPTDPVQCICFDVTGGPSGGPDGTISEEDVQKFVWCGSGKGVQWTPTPECP